MSEKQNNEEATPIMQSLPSTAQTAVTEAIPVVEGLDTENALARIGGNHSLYLNLLHRFLDQQTVPEQIKDKLASGDWLAAERLAHSLKGVAAGLGAGAVQSAAAELERALRAQSDSDALAPLLAEFQTRLADFIARLRAALPQPGTAASDPAQSFDAANVAAVVAEMDAQLGCFDATAAELFEAHRDLFRALLSASQFCAFEKQIANYAFADARSALRQLAAGKEIPLA